MTLRRLPLMFLIAAFCLVPSMSALANGPELAKTNLGKHVTGPEVSVSDFKGRIVIFEQWGINCPPCIAQIPHISKLAKEYGHNRLVVVANHVQGGSTDQVKEVWEKRAKSNHVAVVNGGRLPGYSARGIPNAIMFDQNGKEIWRGHPASIDKPLKEAMQRFRAVRPKKSAEPDKAPIVTDLEASFFERELRLINAQKSSIELSLTKIRRTIERSKRDEQIAEGKAILSAVEQWAEKHFATADSLRSSDPTQAYMIADNTLSLVGKDPAGKDLAAMKAAMEADKPLMDTIRSTRMLREIRAEAEAIGLTKDPTSVDRKAHARALRSIASDLRRMAKNWPDTESGREAAKLLTTWQLEG